MTNFDFFVHYNNGDVIELLKGKSFDDIPKDNIEGLEVKINQGTLFHMHLDEGQQLIFRKRGLGKPVNYDKWPIIYLIGGRKNVSGKDIQSIIYIIDYIGRNRKGFQIHMAGKFREDHPWFFQPQLRKDEVFEGERYFDPKDKVWKTK